MKQKITDLIAPCGIYCGACPSFQISCNGCGSEDGNQKRKSKWSCKIRKCCFEIKKVKFCNECEDFPCKKYCLKLKNSHLGDRRFHYRHELLNNLKRLKQVGIKKWLKEQERKWKCPKCDGTIRFYHYKCSICGFKKQL